LNNRTFFFAAIAAACTLAIAMLANPYTGLTLVDAFQYDSSSSGSGDGNGGGASGEGSPLIIQPGETLGNAVSPAIAGDGVRRDITLCPLRIGPGGEVLPFTFLGEVPSAGYSADGASVLFGVGGGQGVWVDLADCPQAGAPVAPVPVG